MFRNAHRQLSKWPLTFLAVWGLAFVSACGTEGGAPGDPDGGMNPDGGVGGRGGAGGAAGEPGAGGAGGTGGNAAKFHAEDFARPELHGPPLMQGLLDCRFCHGEDLTGDADALSCDTCHTPADPQAWRSDCVFCHGGVENQTGAPPVNLDGSSTSADGSFPPHDAHVTTTLTATLDCVECHVKPVDVLSVGHVFDYPAGVAEVDLGGGRSPRGTYDYSTGGCASLYCHGDGQGDNGSLTTTDGPMSCATCHPGANSPPAELNRMSGPHGFHLAVGATCQDCHQATTTDSVTIADRALHINGRRDTQFSAPGFTRDETQQTCSGTCHGYTHFARPWSGSGGGLHPSGYADPNVHGAEMELQRIDCRSCHGANLSGSAGPSCDSCHTPSEPTAWRSDCVFCHGGDDNSTGAPPRDLGALPMSGSQAFLAHTVHVTQGISRAYDCTQCHRKPSNVLSAEHAFDSTAGRAEVSFTMGLSPLGDYDDAGTCASLYCHGDGQGDNGTVVDGSAAMRCSSCHAGMSSRDRWSTMSGEHRQHLDEGLDCGNCHLDVTADGQVIRSPARHVDGMVQIRFTDTRITYNAVTGRCSGSCHGEEHNSESW